MGPLRLTERELCLVLILLLDLKTLLWKAHSIRGSQSQDKADTTASEVKRWKKPESLTPSLNHQK